MKKSGKGEPLLVVRGDVEQHVGINQNHDSILPTGDGHVLIRGDAWAGGPCGLGQPKIKCHVRTFLWVTRLDLKSLLPGEKLHFSTRTEIESLTHGEWDRDLTFHGDLQKKKYYHSL